MDNIGIQEKNITIVQVAFNDLNQKVKEKKLEINTKKCTLISSME